MDYSRKQTTFKVRPETVSLGKNSPVCIAQQKRLEAVDYDALWDEFQNGDIKY